eukprot:14082090-Alexandrium_andersonii.AAC.1
MAKAGLPSQLRANAIADAGTFWVHGKTTSESKGSAAGGFLRPTLLSLHAPGGSGSKRARRGWGTRGPAWPSLAGSTRECRGSGPR